MNTVRLPRSEVVNFTRQLQVLFASGVPIARAIEVLAEQSHPANACEVFFSLQRLVLEGRYLSSALTRFPAIFSPMYIGLVKVGEQTGQLVISLALLVDWLEHEQEVLQKIRAALIYPTTVVMVAVLAAFLLVNLLAPGFLEMFARDGTPLPWPTLVVSELVKVQRQPWFWLALSAGTILMVRAARSWALNPHWRLSVWQQVIALPGLGGMLSAATWSRFCAALSILSACGVPQQRAFRSAAEVSGDPRLIIDSDLLVRSLLDGEAVWVYMHLKPELYPRLLASSLEVAGDTGQSKPVLDHLARFYREELDVRLQVLQSLIEPLLLITVSGVVLFLSLALILPLYGSLQETI
ncbi:MAG: type II secretion system F family protein [Candidatus Eremiobacteraeota bacterium]|nr:type II secretion system F family protein [Candidatus Eremiobacteraeota bacterium]MCW5869283.1 type II secretion system F family protein [Candidatus Eremiobacteraeota bacterium]